MPADQACSSSSTQNNLVQQLCRLVENLREQNNTMQRQADNRDNRPETVGEAISRLFPSVNGRSNSTLSAQSQITTAQVEASRFSSENLNLSGASNGVPCFEPQRGWHTETRKTKKAVFQEKNLWIPWSNERYHTAAKSQDVIVATWSYSGGAICSRIRRDGRHHHQ